MAVQSRACTDLAESLWKFERNWPPISSQGGHHQEGCFAGVAMALLQEVCHYWGGGFEVSNAQDITQYHSPLPAF